MSSDNWATLETGFKDPKAEYRTAPFAVWNGKVTKEEVERTIQELKDAGSGGAFIHPRPGSLPNICQTNGTLCTGMLSNMEKKMI